MWGMVRRLARDQWGSALPIMAAGLIPLLAAIGSAVDLGRVYMVRAQMQAGVDAGALAGARSFGLTTERTEQVGNYFLANMPTGLLGSGTITPVGDFQTTSGINRVKVDATTDLPMIFMHLFGVNSMNIAVTATAEMQPRPLEVMVVLDDTGSMKTALGSGTRMTALKTSMYDFINILHQGKAKREDLAMGFVTYTVTTNVGKILKDAGVTIQVKDGFTNSTAYTGYSGTGQDPLGWYGCVENDQTVKDLSSSATTMEAGAYDIDKVLPGEGGRPGVRPYHYPPMLLPVDNSAAWATSSRIAANYAVRSTPQDDRNPSMIDGRRNNLYRLAAKGDTVTGNLIANKAAYKQHFYDFYIGLNYDANPNDDVIVKNDGTYYLPGSGTSADWKVEYSRLPFIDDDTNWGAANPAYGYPTRPNTTSPNTNLKMATPNWQCPNPGMKVSYGRNKSDYDDYITYDNYALMPASGTLHHIGMLWGYRLLTRSDVFTRTIPSQFQGEEPKRALVFMTDGDTAAGGDAMWYGAYGSMREKRIAASDSNFINQVMYRFAKVCENAKRDGIEVYIVSLLATANATKTAFRGCAGANFKETSTQSEIQQAFRQIAVDLIDLHLTN